MCFFSTSYAGQVGYAMMNMRNTDEAKIGDTFFHENKHVDPLPGFKDATPMVSGRDWLVLTRSMVSDRDWSVLTRSMVSDRDWSVLTRSMVSGKDRSVLLDQWSVETIGQYLLAQWSVARIGQ